MPISVGSYAKNADGVAKVLSLHGVPSQEDPLRGAQTDDVPEGRACWPIGRPGSLTCFDHNSSKSTNFSASRL